MNFEISEGQFRYEIVLWRIKVQLLEYADSDFAGNVDSQRSTTGYVFTLGNELVSWVSRLQKIVALSTIEAEYVAATKTCKVLT